MTRREFVAREVEFWTRQLAQFPTKRGAYYARKVAQAARALERIERREEEYQAAVMVDPCFDEERECYNARHD